jgi:hypothetical protein
MSVGRKTIVIRTREGGREGVIEKKWINDRYNMQIYMHVYMYTGYGDQN